MKFSVTVIHQTTPCQRQPAQAKDFIARKKYHVHLDLSNWFYQSGMDRKDIQFLGTVHPYKGVMVYSAEPMGLNGAPEHSYEKLGRIYWDLIRDERCTRMADGVHIGGDQLGEVKETLREVFTRARLAGLTFKPSKIEICPAKTILFGWQLENGMWSPTVHTTSTLASAPRPKTVKQLRSFLGAFKQFTSCVRRYGELLTQLEALTGSHKPSAEVIQWTEEQEKAFFLAREATKDIEAYSIPRPSDRLFTYSDYSRDNKAVGARWSSKGRWRTGPRRGSWRATTPWWWTPTSPLGGPARGRPLLLGWSSSSTPSTSGRVSTL